MLIGARLVFRVVSAITAIIIARYLDENQFGAYSLALSMVDAILLCNDLGMTTLLLREGSRDKTKLQIYFGNALLVEAIASVIFLTIAITVSGLLYSQTVAYLVLLLGAATVFYEFRKPMRSIFRIMMNMKTVIWFDIAYAVLCFGGVLAISKLITPGQGLFWVAIIQVIVSFAVIAAFAIYDFKYLKPKFSLRLIPPMLKESWIFALYTSFYTLYLQISQLIIGILRDEKEVAYYSAASKMVIFVLIIPQMVYQMVLPVMFRLSKTDLPKYKRVNITLHRYFAALGYPMAVGTLLLASPIMDLLYKGKYQEGVPALQWFSFFILMRFTGNASGQSLTALDKQKTKVIIESISVVLNIILVALAVPKYGFIGAVVATVIVEAIMRLIFLRMDNYYLQISGFTRLKNILPVILASLTMGVFIYFTRDFINVIVLTLLGFIIYVFLLWIFRFFKEYDKQLFKQLIPARFQKNESTDSGGRNV